MAIEPGLKFRAPFIGFLFVAIITRYLTDDLTVGLSAQ
jgi:hypothetical protein